MYKDGELNSIVRWAGERQLLIGAAEIIKKGNPNLFSISLGVGIDEVELMKLN